MVFLTLMEIKNPSEFKIEPKAVPARQPAAAAPVPAPAPVKPPVIVRHKAIIGEIRPAPVPRTTLVSISG